MRQVGIRYSLAIAVRKSFEFARGQYFRQGLLRQAREFYTDFLVAELAVKVLPMLVGYLQEPFEILFCHRAPVDAQEIDDLDQKPGLTPTRLANRLYEFAQSWNETIVADAKQWATRNVANAGCLYDDCTGPAFGIARIPVEYIPSHHPVFGRAPGDHGRHPGTLRKLDRPHSHRAEKARRFRLFTRRPRPRIRFVLDSFLRSPHARQLLPVNREANCRRIPSGIDMSS